MPEASRLQGLQSKHIKSNWGERNTTTFGEDAEWLAVVDMVEVEVVEIKGGSWVGPKVAPLQS